MKSSLRFLIKATLGIASGILIVVIFLSLSTLGRQIETQFKHDADEKAELGAELVGNSLLISDFHEIQKTVETFATNSRVINVEVRNRFGDVIASTESHRRIKSEKIYLSEVLIRNEQAGSEALGTFRVQYSYDDLNRLFILHFGIVLGAILSLFGALLWALVFSLKSFMQYLSTLMEQFRKLVENRPSSMKLFGWIKEFSDVSTGFDEILAKVKYLRETEHQQMQYKIIGQISAQVAHDIRSPLAALDSMTNSVAQLPEDDRLIIRSAVNRIKDIANNLIDRNRELESPVKLPALECARTNPSLSTSEPAIIQLLSSLVDPLITEKRMQFRAKIGVTIEGRIVASSYGLFAHIQPTEFQRVLSNLINNSVEALGINGTVTISLASTNDQIKILVTDNGCGIPQNLLTKLGQRGETFGKQGGSGLGLYHARTSIERWDGKLEIQSAVGRGTSIVITLPQAKPPEWFVSELKLDPNSTVIALDDDSSVHGIWQGRFDSARIREHGIDVLHFSTPLELRSWVKSNPVEAELARYLTDQELIGFTETGLSLIEELNIASRSILVTSRFEEPQIRDSCARLKVRLIPKGLAGFVPIRILGHSEAAAYRTTKNEERLVRARSARESDQPSAVLIDDDPLVHMVWKTSAKRAEVNALCFFGAAEFLEDSDNIDRKVPVYIDSCLGEGVKGEEIAREIKALGFETIYLATGLAPIGAEQLTWLTGIRGKEPPFDEPEFAKFRTSTPSPTDLSPVIDDAAYTRIRRYFHDLLKPIQQTATFLDLLSKTGIDEPEFAELCQNLTTAASRVTEIRNTRLTQRGSMSEAELRMISDLDDELLRSFDEIASYASAGLHDLKSDKTSGDLTKRAEEILTLSSNLTRRSTTLLNNIKRA